MSWKPISTRVPFAPARNVLNGGNATSGKPRRTAPVRMKGAFPCCAAKYAKKLVKKTSRALREVASSHSVPPNNRRFRLASGGVLISFSFYKVNKIKFQFESNKPS